MNTNHKGSILLVDDENANLLTLHKILSPDYEIRMVKSGIQALKLIAEHRPDLILMDVLMPEMDGFAVLSVLKNDMKTKAIPVIFITGLSDISDEEKGFLLGAVDYIKKPFNATIVKARVHTQMEIARQIRVNAELARIDALTGLPNRRNFEERLTMEWRRAIRDKTPIAFLMLDIDKFKIYNDTYGHLQGDKMLKVAARIFQESAQRPSDMAARLGGEEFGVLLPQTDGRGGQAVAERIRRKMEITRVPLGDGVTMTSATVSIGVACANPLPGQDVNEFLGRADASLYDAKENGRNRISVAPGPVLLY
ncbi:MAG: diguanylate cyclase [Synergistaceae bacterium]|nr:diguanylate cyclase [Synergistaceae bacterium]